LAHAAGVTAWVYADGTAANNAVYTKSGASGSGSWAKTITCLTDAQRPIYLLEQHGSRSTTVTYQALFKSADGGISYSFVRDFAIGTYASGGDGLYFVLVAPNGDIMIHGKKGLWLSTDGGVNFSSEYTREVSAAHFYGGSSTTPSGARLGDATATTNGGVWTTANVRTTAFAMPTGAGGATNAGLPASFNVWDMECAPSNQSRLLVCSDTNDAYLSTDGGKNFSKVTSASGTGEAAVGGGFRFTFAGKPAGGHSGFLFCPTNEQRVVGFTSQTVSQSIDGGASFQGDRAAYFDGLHSRGTGTGPLTGATPWKELLTVSQDSLAATWMDGLNWMQRCGLSTGDDSFKAALEAAGAGNKPYVSGAAGLILPNNRVVCCAHRNQGGQSCVMVILYERNATTGEYPNYLIKNLSTKATRGIHSAWSLADPDGYGFIGRWGIGDVGAAVGSISFDDHSGHEFFGQRMDGSTQVSYWGSWASGAENGTGIYISDHPEGLNGQGTAWFTAPSHYCRNICINPHASEHVYYVRNSEQSKIRQIKRSGGSLVDSALLDGSGNPVDLRPLIVADFNARFPGGAPTIPETSFTDICQIMADPNMPGLMYAVVGIQGIPNVWMRDPATANWINVSDNLPRSLWFGSIHAPTGDLIVDGSLGRHVLPPPTGYPAIPYKGALSAQQATFFGKAAVPNPPVF
jgi:hypothetical protein